MRDEKTQSNQEQERSAHKVIELPIGSLRLHPEAARVPVMRDEERVAFAADVQARGIQVPILVQESDLILDGRHRWEEAAKRGDVTIPAFVVSLDEDEQVARIYQAASLRRHLTDDQRAVLAARLAEVEIKKTRSKRARKAGEAGGRGRAKEDSSADDASAKLSTGADGTGRTPRADEEAARQHSVPQRKVRTALQVGRAAPELAEKVLAGEMSLSKAKRQRKRQQQPEIDRETPAVAPPSEAVAETAVALAATTAGRPADYDREVLERGSANDEEAAAGKEVAVASDGAERLKGDETDATALPEKKAESDDEATPIEPPEATPAVAEPTATASQTPPTTAAAAEAAKVKEWLRCWLSTCADCLTHHAGKLPALAPQLTVEERADVAGSLARIHAVVQGMRELLAEPEDALGCKHRKNKNKR